jgi:hypothetical protein
MIIDENDSLVDDIPSKTPAEICFICNKVSRVKLTKGTLGAVVVYA